MTINDKMADYLAEEVEKLDAAISVFADKLALGMPLTPEQQKILFEVYVNINIPARHIRHALTEFETCSNCKELGLVD